MPFPAYSALNLTIIFSSLLGFIFLAIATERHSKILLHYLPSLPVRRVFRVLGWLSLTIAFILACYAWDWSVGLVAWLWWIGVVAVILVFYLPWWPWQKKVVAKAPIKPKAPIKSKETSTTPVVMAEPTHGRKLYSALIVLLLIMVPIGFYYQLSQAPVKPYMRADAVKGQIGPWPFAFAEEKRRAPEISSSGVATKNFELRFCEECDKEIAAAYLKIRKPRSVKKAGNNFYGNSGSRSVEIYVPPGAKLEDQLWLTVVGKDGQVYYQAFDFAAVSPKTAQFIQKKRQGMGLE